MKSLMQFVVPENIHTPATESTFALDPPPPGISILVGACRASHPLEFLNFFNLVGYPLEIIFPSKMLLHYIITRKIFCDKMRINLFIHVNTVSNNLKDFLS